MIKFYVECAEKLGTVTRYYREVDRTPKNILEIVDKVVRVPNFLFKQLELTYSELLNYENALYQIDDAGIVFFKPRPPFTAEVHITFWDGRLRGREEICREIGRDFLIQRGIREGRFVTAVPHDRKAVIAFARRIGFKVSLSQDERVTVLVLDLPSISTMEIGV